MGGRGLQRPLAGQEDEQPEGGFEDAPGEQELGKGRGGRVGDGERAVEDAEGRDGAQEEDADADEDIFGDAGSDHDDVGGVKLRARELWMCGI